MDRERKRDGVSVCRGFGGEEKRGWTRRALTHRQEKRTPKKSTPHPTQWLPQPATIMFPQKSFCARRNVVPDRGGEGDEGRRRGWRMAVERRRVGLSAQSRKSGVAASLCHRSPKCRGWFLRVFEIFGGAECGAKVLFRVPRLRGPDRLKAGHQTLSQFVAARVHAWLRLRFAL
jgi:hypothetical protein